MKTTKHFDSSTCAYNLSFAVKNHLRRCFLLLLNLLYQKTRTRLFHSKIILCMISGICFNCHVAAQEDCEGVYPSTTTITTSNVFDLRQPITGNRGGNTCVPPQICNASASEVSKYIPYRKTPIKTVRLRVILFHYSASDPRNFEASNPTHVQLLKDQVANLNYRYGNIISTTDPACGEENFPCAPPGTINTLSDSKIRFDLDENNIYEIVDPYVWNGDNFFSCGSAKAAADAAAQPYIASSFGGNSAINVYFVGSQCKYEEEVLQSNSCNLPDGHWIQKEQACANLPSSNLNAMSSTIMGDKYNGYRAANNGYLCSQYSQCCPSCPYSWQTDAGTWIHELGHNLGLGHASQCNVNFMNDVGNSPRTYLFLNQIGQMHRMLSLSNVRRYVKCTYGGAYVVTGDETWVHDTRKYGDVVVEPLATLTIKCNVWMPRDGKIIVKRGGKLIVDGGKLYTKWCGGQWEGIEVWGNSNLSHPQHSDIITGSYPNASNQQGVVWLLNDAVIEHAHNGIRLGRRHPDGWAYLDYGGGILLAENSLFHKCWRAVEFYKYNQYNNISQFIGCNFETSPALVHPSGAPSTFVTLWNVHGVEFIGNTFINNDPDYFGLMNRGNGIGSIDASYLVNGNTFTSLFRGIESSGSNTILSYIDVTENLFEDVQQGVYVDGQSFNEFSENVFRHPSSAFIDNSWVDSWGIVMENAQAFEVKDNTFHGAEFMTDFIRIWSVFNLLIRNSGTLGGIVKENEFVGAGINSQAEQDNSALQFHCNRYYQGDGTVNLYVPSGPLADQGGCGPGMTQANNAFLSYPNPNDCSGSKRQIFSVVSFTYHDAFNNPAPPDPSCIRPEVNYVPCLEGESKYDCDGGGGGGAGEGIVLPASSPQAMNYLGQIIRDTLRAGATEAAMALLRSADSVHGIKMLLVNTYYASNKLDSAEFYLNSIPDSGHQNEAFHALYDMLLEVHDSGRTINALDSLEKQTLHTLEVDSTTYASSLARRVLRLAYGERFRFIPEKGMLDSLNTGIVSLKHGAGEESPPEAGEEEQDVAPDKKTAYLRQNRPNPFSDQTVIDYYLPEHVKKGNLVIYDMTGSLKKAYILANGSGQVVIDGSDLPPGVYLYKLEAYDKAVDYKKMVVFE